MKLLKLLTLGLLLAQPVVVYSNELSQCTKLFSSNKDLVGYSSKAKSRTSIIPLDSPLTLEVKFRLAKLHQNNESFRNFMESYEKQMDRQIQFRTTVDYFKNSALALKVSLGKATEAEENTYYREEMRKDEVYKKRIKGLMEKQMEVLSYMEINSHLPIDGKLMYHFSHMLSVIDLSNKKGPKWLKENPSEYFQKKFIEILDQWVVDLKEKKQVNLEEYVTQLKNVKSLRTFSIHLREDWDIKVWIMEDFDSGM